MISCQSILGKMEEESLKASSFCMLILCQAYISCNPLKYSMTKEFYYYHHLPVKLRKVNFCELLFTQLINDLRGFKLGSGRLHSCILPLCSLFGQICPWRDHLVIFLLWALSTLGLPVFVCGSRRTDQRCPWCLTLRQLPRAIHPLQTPQFCTTRWSWLRLRKLQSQQKNT